MKPAPAQDNRADDPGTYAVFLAVSPRLRRIAALVAVEGANASAGDSTARAIRAIVESTVFMASFGRGGNE